MSNDAFHVSSVVARAARWQGKAADGTAGVDAT